MVARASRSVADAGGTGGGRDRVVTRHKQEAQQSFFCSRSTRTAGSSQREAKVAHITSGDRATVTGQRIYADAESAGPEGRRVLFRGRERGRPAFASFGLHLTHIEWQDEELDEYEGLYDDLNLDEEEAKFGLVGEEDESDESDRESEGSTEFLLSRVFHAHHLLILVRHEIPPRTPNKKIVHDDEPSKPHESPVLRKASASIRSEFETSFPGATADFFNL